jgi:hypothetical protein
MNRFEQVLPFLFLFVTWIFHAPAVAAVSCTESNLERGNASEGFRG